MDLSSATSIHFNEASALSAFKGSTQVWSSGPPGPSENFVYPSGSIYGVTPTTYTDPVTGFTWEVFKFTYSPDTYAIIAGRQLVAYVFGIAGGGGNGYGRPSRGIVGGYGGGGGAYLNEGHVLTPGVHYVTVGAGGPGRGDGNGPATNGGNSSLDDIVLLGGGGGGGRYYLAGLNGGCGGGISGYGGTPGLSIQGPPGVGFDSVGVHGGGIVSTDGTGLTLNIDGAGNKPYGYGYNGQSNPDTGSGGSGNSAWGANGVFFIKYRIA